MKLFKVTVVAPFLFKFNGLKGELLRYKSNVLLLSRNLCPASKL